MVRNIFSILLGLVAAVAAIVVFEVIANKVYPAPSDIDFANRVAAAAYITKMPLGAFGLLLGGYISGAFLGGLVAAFIKPIYATRNAISVGVIVLFGALMNFVNLPHPTWFVAASLCCFVPFAWLGSWVASRFAQ